MVCIRLNQTELNWNELNLNKLNGMELTKFHQSNQMSRYQ